jgi:hypothetical protein
MSLKDYRISLLPHITRLVADATATKAAPMGALAPASPTPRRRSLFLAPKQNQHFLMVLFAGYADIADSLSHLRQVDRYLARTPPRAAPITRSAYLSYHYNAFLNNLAILDERIAHHLALLSHKYRFEPDAARIQKALEELQKLVTAAFKPAAALAAQQSQEKQFTHPEIEHFRLLEQISASPQSPFPKSAVEQSFKHARKIIRDTLQEHTLKAEGVVDSVFRVLKQLVMRGGGVRFPVR